MCHKTASLAANALESSGIATVVIGTLHHPLLSAPRSLITPYRDAPCGPPHEHDLHRKIVSRAVDLLYRRSRTMENFEQAEAAVS